MIQKRIKRLKKVVAEYLTYTKWEAVLVFLREENVFVAWARPRALKGDKMSFYLEYTSRTFPTGDLTKRIRSYKDKIVVEKAKLKEEKK